MVNLSANIWLLVPACMKLFSLCCMNKNAFLLYQFGESFKLTQIDGGLRKPSRNFSPLSFVKSFFRNNAFPHKQTSQSSIYNLGLPYLLTAIEKRWIYDHFFPNFFSETGVANNSGFQMSNLWNFCPCISVFKLWSDLLTFSFIEPFFYLRNWSP